MVKITNQSQQLAVWVKQIKALNILMTAHTEKHMKMDRLLFMILTEKYFLQQTTKEIQKLPKQLLLTMMATDLLPTTMAM